MKARENEMQFLFVLADLLLLNISFFIVFFLFRYEYDQPIDVYLMLLIGNFSWVLAHLFVRKKLLYTQKRFRVRFMRMIKRIAVFVIIALLTYLPFRPLIYDLWPFLIYSCLLFGLLKLTSNYLYYRIIRYKYKRSAYTRITLLIGMNETMQKVRKILKANPVLRFRVIGFLTDNGHDAHRKSDHRVLGTVDQLEEIVKSKGVHAIYKAVYTEDELRECASDKDELLKLCNRLGIRLYYVPLTQKMETCELCEEYIRDLLIVNPQKIPLDIVENQVKKRIFDLVFSGLVILLLMSWFYPLMALLIKLSSKGPVMFKQKRTGINKVNFDCYKFRSMEVNDEADSKQATANDPRITKIGRFMRKTNIDELPQFFNVFKGQMSVVGPRPHMLKHTDEYSAQIEDFLVRHYVKPGITGWAQINGLRGETKELWMMQKRVEYDKYYIRNWSLDWDFVIVWKTIFHRKAFKNAL